MNKMSFVAVTAGCIACAASVQAADFVVNERNTSSIWRWDPGSGNISLYHTTQANDADINVPEGSSFGWIAEHFQDNFGRFVPGSSSGLDSQYVLGVGGRTHYHYPKHVTVFDSKMVVMSRNDATIWRYDENGNELASTPTGNGVGQGMATDGTDFYASFWNGSNSYFERYDSSFVLQQRIALPSPMRGMTNIVDFAYDATTGRFFGLVTNYEQGTSTESNLVYEFTMGGQVFASYALPFMADGIGQFDLDDCPADIDGSDAVDFDDLLLVLAAWGPYEPCPPFKSEDIDESCDVGFDDLLLLLAAWGPCP